MSTVVRGLREALVLFVIAAVVIAAAVGINGDVTGWEWRS